MEYLCHVILGAYTVNV